MFEKLKKQFRILKLVNVLIISLIFIDSFNS